VVVLNALLIICATITRVMSTKFFLLIVLLLLANIQNAAAAFATIVANTSVEPVQRALAFNWM
jgi:hypothetical protein